MIRITYLYRLTNLSNRRVFYGIHSTTDISFANPPVRLSDLCRTAPMRSADGVSVRYDTLPEFTNKFLAHDLKSIGLHNFIIESIYASALKSDVDRVFNQHVNKEFLKSPLAYNGMIAKPHRCTSEDNPMKTESARAKMSKILKSKVIVRDSKGRIKRIEPVGYCKECKLVDAHKLSCSFYGMRPLEILNNTCSVSISQ
jgi:hypothetical protein